MDSVIALFRVDFSGRGELAERQVFSSVHFEALVKKLKDAILSSCLWVSGMKLQKLCCPALPRLLSSMLQCTSPTKVSCPV